MIRYLMIAVKNVSSRYLPNNPNYASEFEKVVSASGLRNVQAVIAYSVHTRAGECTAPAVAFTSSCHFGPQVVAELAAILDTAMRPSQRSLFFCLSPLASSEPLQSYHIAPLPPFGKAQLDWCNIWLYDVPEEAVEKHLPAVMHVTMALLGASLKIWDPTTQFNALGLPNERTFLDSEEECEFAKYYPPGFGICNLTLANAAVSIQAVCMAGYCLVDSRLII
jgi:hypothetical protein